ncbi:MAG: type II secretion system F family protein [Minisyncoccia bacterium]
MRILNFLREQVIHLKERYAPLYAELIRVRGTPRLSVTEQMLLSKRLSFLIGANVSVVESFHILKEQSRSPRVRYVYDRVIEDVSNGQYIHTSLGKFGGSFGTFMVNLIKVGELSGSLTQNLGYLAEELRKRHLLKKKVIGALIYPVIITVATLGITGLLTVFIFPKIMPVFTSLKVELPLTTKVLLAVSVFLKEYGLFLILGLILLALISGILYTRFARVRYLYDRASFVLPIVGTVIRSYHIANFCRTLGILLKSGMTLLEGVYIMAETMGSEPHARALGRVVEGIRAGKQLSVMLAAEQGLYPHLMTHMIGVGERTGNLSGTLIYLSDYYESEVDDLTRNLSSAIEPILMVVMGLLVGLVAVSVITPIYEITNRLSR